MGCVTEPSGGRYLAVEKFHLMMVSNIHLCQVSKLPAARRYRPSDLLRQLQNVVFSTVFLFLTLQFQESSKYALCLLACFSIVRMSRIFRKTPKNHFVKVYLNVHWKF